MQHVLPGLDLSHDELTPWREVLHHRPQDRSDFGSIMRGDVYLTVRGLAIPSLNGKGQALSQQEIPDPDAYVNRAIAYKLKLLLPPALWRSLPVKIDGTSWKRTFKGTATLVKELEAAGMLSAASHDTHLMSVCAGMETRVLRDQMRQALMAGDAERVRELTDAINAGC